MTVIPGLPSSVVSGPSVATGIKAANVNCPAGVTTPLVAVPCPPLIAGSDSSRVAAASALLLIASVQPNPPAGTTQMVFSIDAMSDSAATSFFGNLAFWPMTDFATGESQAFTFTWLWMPRSSSHLGDVDLGDGSGKWIALRLLAAGATVAAQSFHLTAIPLSGYLQPTLGDTW